MTTSVLSTFSRVIPKPRTPRPQQHTIRRNRQKEYFSSDVGSYITGIALHGEMTILGVVGRILERLPRTHDCNGGSA
jgi:hypothetical protein